MARWLLLFMLIVLPLQFATAAAAAYCRHEASGSAKHFGHHEHRHHGSSEQASLDAPGSHAQNFAGFGDPDCEYCQLGAVHPVLPSFEQSSTAFETGPPLHGPLAFESRSADTLYRPNWPALA